MDAFEVMKERHSVRQYTDKRIEEKTRAILNDYIEELNTEGKLNIQIFYDEPECFNSMMARYGHFENVNNYIAMVGRKEKSLDERCGYYGEKLVLKAQELGLNTCWVGLTHGKTKTVVKRGEKETIIISLGYGKTQGVPHHNKDIRKIADLKDDDPEWYRRGIEAVLLAPTAINQQKFYFSRKDNIVSASSTSHAAYTRMDLGIAKCHFELGAGKENFRWK